VPKVLIAMVFFLVGAAALSGQAQAQPLSRTVILVDTVSLPTKVPRAHERMRAKLEATLAARGWVLAQVVPPSACVRTADCLPKVAKQASAGYALRLSGEGNSENGYNVTLDLFSAADGQMRTNAAYCDLCNVDSLAEILKRMGMEMLDSAEETAAKASQSRVAQPVAPPPKPPQAAPSLVSPPAAPEPESVSWVPWTLVAAGAAAGAYGFWALHKDGERSGSCSPTHDPTTCERYSGRGLGIGAALGGGALFLGGAIWGVTSLLRSASVSASPNHVALNVRF
jgi:hypothetical protein